MNKITLYLILSLAVLGCTGRWVQDLGYVPDPGLKQWQVVWCYWKILKEKYGIDYKVLGHPGLPGPDARAAGYQKVVLPVIDARLGSGWEQRIFNKPKPSIASIGQKSQINIGKIHKRADLVDNPIRLAG